MDNSYYSIERNAQIVVSLLKAKGIKKVVASPGTTNIAIVGSMMHDKYFEMYSAPDERSAAYIACGLSSESGEPVVLTCTGATASRNYFPGLTEAYYRKLPVIAITSTLNLARSGHLQAQFCDRTIQPVDLVKYSVQIPVVENDEDEWECNVKVNSALLECKRHGGGPVHINLTTHCELYNFSVKDIKPVRNIERYGIKETLPTIKGKKVAIFIGAHKTFDKKTTKSIECFCASNNAVVFCDNTSGYHGKYRVCYALVAAQTIVDHNMSMDILIHIGEVSGDYYTTGKLNPKEVWRVNPDGEIRDYFRRLSKVFEMDESEFFDYYSDSVDILCDYYNSCESLLTKVRSSMGEFPFSNIWAAQQIAPNLPHGSYVHLGILNSLRSWNFFDLPNDVFSSCNVGGFGIDGILSTLIGAALVNKDRLHFCFVGDLAFFYDINSLGNRHVPKNLRILLINNGKGTEFRNHTHPGSKFGDDADLFIAAGGHYGNKSKNLVKHYSEDLGFKYLSASNKEEFIANMNVFISDDWKESSIIMEMFVTNEQEDEALKIVLETLKDGKLMIESKVKSVVRDVAGDKFVNALKSFVRK